MANLRGRDRERYVARMFGRIACHYDRLNTIMTFGRHQAWRRLATEFVCAQGICGPVLDVATGTGDFAIELARKHGVSEVVGLDFTRQMLPIAVRKTKDGGHEGNIQYVVGDAHTLPFPDNTFVAVTVGFGVRNFVDVPVAIKEVLRVLKPGGRIAILEIVRMERRRILDRLFVSGFRILAPWLGMIFASDREAYTYLPESVRGFLTVGGLVNLIGEAGFCQVVVKQMALGSVAIVIGEKADR
ncbi:MAG: ubiquinone/menaquinone biosynthesis methyltransferase [SAR202 cluster bacterium]|nr:ubiquinone/menaquinone biosynthesis methyltransferase [SAR202 cluster bacterium]